MTVVDFDVDTVETPGFKTYWGIEGYVFTKQTEEHDQTAEAAELDGDTFGSRFSNMLPGIQKATTKINGMHSNIKGQVGDVLRSYVGVTSQKRAWAARESLNALAPIEFQPCSVTKYSPKSTKKDVVKFDAELTARGAFNNGFILVSPKGTTQMTTTGMGSVDDNTSNGGSTSFGGAAQLVMYDISGGTSPTVAPLVQHSPDGTTWTTLATFTTCNPTTASTLVQRVKVPSATVVNQQIRASWTTAGTPTSVQGMIMFGRGVDPDS